MGQELTKISPQNKLKTQLLSHCKGEMTKLEFTQNLLWAKHSLH